MGYRAEYDRWLADPEAYWLKQAQAIDWVEPPTTALYDRGDDIYEWFAEAKVNTCWNAVDRHVENGRGDQVAIIHDSPITGTSSTITYAALRDQVAHFAGALAARGIGMGDRVIIYMPMVPEGVKTEKSDKAVSKNYMDMHLKIGIESLMKLSNNSLTIKHLRF